MTYIDVIYPDGLVIRDATDAPEWDNYLDHRLEFDEDGILYTWFVRNMKFCFVQRIYSGFEVIELWILFTEPSKYFWEIILSSYRPCSKIGHVRVTYV